MIHLFEGSKPDQTQSWLYAVCSLTYLGAMVSSNSALLYVNYPTQVSRLAGTQEVCDRERLMSFCPNNCLLLCQVLGKSCKPIPGN